MSINLANAPKNKNQFQFSVKDFHLTKQIWTDGYRFDDQ